MNLSADIAGSKRSERGWLLVALILMAIGLVLRIWKAWTGHLSPNSDFAIVCLAAKHMVEGVDLPVFFYGQPYMGNLESSVAAILCRVFGLVVSGFTTNLAPALTGALLLPLVYLWAKDAGSRRAGVLALLFCIVGSDTNFHYAVAARGAYMATMVCGVLSLWLAARIAATISRGEKPGILSSAITGARCRYRLVWDPAGCLLSGRNGTDFAGLVQTERLLQSVYPCIRGVCGRQRTVVVVESSQFLGKS